MIRLNNQRNGLFNTSYKHPADITGEGILGKIANFLPAREGSTARKQWNDENHSLLRLPNGGFGVANYMGPDTHITERIERKDPPRTKSDAVSQRHDIDYALSQLQPDEEGRVKAVREADRRMVKKLNEIKKNKGDHPMNIALGQKVIQGKMLAENFGLLRKGAFGDKLGGLPEKDVNILMSKKKMLEQEGYGANQTLLKKAMKMTGKGKYSKNNYTVKPTNHRGHGTNPAGIPPQSGKGWLSNLAKSIFKSGVNSGKNLLKKKIEDGTVGKLLTKGAETAGTKIGTAISDKVFQKTGMEVDVAGKLTNLGKQGATMTEGKLRQISGSGLFSRLVDKIKVPEKIVIPKVILDKLSTDQKKGIELVNKFALAYIDGVLKVGLQKGTGLNLAGKKRHSGCGYVIDIDKVYKAEMEGGFFAAIFAFFAWLSSAIATAAAVPVLGTTVGAIAGSVGSAVGSVLLEKGVEALVGDGMPLSTEKKRIVNKIGKVKLSHTDFNPEVVQKLGEKLLKDDSKGNMLKLAKSILPQAKVVFAKKLSTKMNGSGLRLSGKGIDSNIMTVLKKTQPSV